MTRRLFRVIVGLVLENKRLREENERLNKMNHDQARIIFTLRRVLRFFGFDEVVIEDEHIELGESEDG